MGTSHDLAKITIPRLGNIYNRRRLFQLLDKACERPFIWIKGPPGAGKTCLVGSYIQHRKIKPLWYQLDERDADVGSFFHYLGLATKKYSKKYRKPMPILTPEYLHGLPVFTRNYFEILFGRLKTPTAFVFDNYQDAPADSQLHKILAMGMQEAPDGVNMFFLSRTDPPAPFARYRASGSMTVIDWKNLAFTLEETCGLIRSRRKNFRKDHVQQIHKIASGWVAGITLIIESGESLDADADDLTQRSYSGVFDYFTYEVMLEMSETNRGALIKSVYFPRFTPEMLDKLTGDASSGRILETLNRKNYFVERRSSPKTEYQYHALFHEFLLARAEKIFDEETRYGIKKKVAHILEEYGYAEEAIESSIEIKDWEGAARIIITNAQSMLEQGRARSLAKWLQSFPEDVLDFNPWLLFWFGKSLQPYDLKKSRDCFEKSFHLFKKVHDRTGLFLSWAGIAENVQYERDDIYPLDRWIAEMERVLKENQSFPSPEVEALISYAMFSSLLIRQPENPAMEFWEQKLKSTALMSEDVNMRALAGYILGVAKMWMAESAEAGSVVSTLSLLRKSENVTPIIKTTAYATEVMYHWLAGDSPEDSMRLADEGVEVSEGYGVYAWYLHILEHGAAAALSKDDVERADKYLERIKDNLAVASMVDRAYFHFLSAWRHLVKRTPASALCDTHAFLDTSVKSGIKWGILLSQSLAAEVMFENGDTIECDKLLRVIRDDNEKIKNGLISFMSLATDTRLTLKMGDEVRSLELLRKMFRLGREKRIRNCFGWRHSVMADLCVLALKNNIEVDYARELIKTRGLVPQTAPLELDNWPWPVRIYTLSRFSLLIDGKPICFSGKTQKKPLELLKALISLGGREVGEVDLIDTLWPEAEGDAGHSVFGATLHRLRKILGHEKALVLQDNKLTLDDRYCWVDAWAFERALGEVDAAVESDEGSAVEISVNRALDLYKAPFLRDESNQPWTVTIREKLRNKLFRRLSKAADYFKDNGAAGRATELYLKALEVEPLAEELYGRLMSLYEKTEARGEALSLRNRYHETIVKPLGVIPASEIEDIYHRLISKG